ncbi:MAG: DNA-directed RNA polymerase specialized sigma24 family protein, partial [Planctomycetota bacterium]
MDQRPEQRSAQTASSAEPSLSDSSWLQGGTWLRRLAIELVGDEASAEDLLQDTWTVLQRTRGTEIGD